jgi:hypothetical protein
MRFLILVFAVGAGAFYWFNRPAEQPMKADQIPARDLRSYRNIGAQEPHPCVEKTRCLVAYMAPWCPNCKDSIPFYQHVREILQPSPDVGTMLVLSPLGRSWSDYGGIARRIGGRVMLDPEDRAWTPEVRRNVGGVPAWVVYDGTGSITTAFSGGFSNTTRSDARAVLENRLKLGTYLN